MAQIRVYSGIVRGFIEYTGNTIDMLNASSVYVKASIPPGPPSGTLVGASSWATAGSAAFLRGLAGSTVFKAYLAWMGTPVPNVNGTATSQDIAVTFGTPTGNNSVTGNPAWSQNYAAAGQQFNIRVADVTSIVQVAGTGQYSVTGVPSGQNYTGWTLAVIWKNNSLPPRFISVDTYDDLVGGAFPSTLSLTVSGFITPSTGTVSGRAAMAVGSAESWTISGPVAFGRTVATGVNLIGPNNPTTAFFQMQINDGNSESATVGQLDKTGTFGNLNSPLNQSAAVPNVRYHWDQTNVSITSGLTVNQTSGVFTFGPASNAYSIHMLSLQIDVKSPILETTKYVDKTQAEVGDTITYTLVVTNTGNFDTDNLIVIDTIPNGTSFNTGTVTVDGVTVPVASPLPPSGFDAGSIAQSQTKTITFKITALTASAYTTINNTFGTGYRYSPGAGITLNGSTSSNTVSTYIYGNPSIPNNKSVSKTYANVGDILVYTIILSNSGTATATNVVLIDTIPNDTSFITNSLTVNGVTINGVSPAPPTGYTVGTIGANKATTITFQVRVNTIPSPNPIPNVGTISYNYQTSITKSSGSGTNTVRTQVNNANLGNVVKYADKSFATCGDSATCS